MSKSSLQLLFDYIDDGNREAAGKVLKMAKSEYEALDSKLETYFSKLPRSSKGFCTQYIEHLIHHYEANDKADLQSYLEMARNEYKDILNKLGSFEKTSIPDKDEINDNGHMTTRTDQMPDHFIVPEPATNARVSIEERIESQTESEEKQDSSVINKPWSKENVIKEFGQLYEELWADGYEELKSCAHRELREQEVLKILLNIVLDAFRFTSEESKKQITCLDNTMRNVVAGEPVMQTGSRRKEDKDVDLYPLVQYRLHHAWDTVTMLQTKFIEHRLEEVLQKASISRMTTKVKILEYARQAIKVTWWMNVQIPPMCISCKTTRAKDYKQYISKGSRLECVVWPILLGKPDGPSLSRGVAIFK